MLPFGVTIPATVPQGSEIPEGLTNYPICIFPVDFMLSSPWLILLRRWIHSAAASFLLPTLWLINDNLASDAVIKRLYFPEVFRHARREYSDCVLWVLSACDVACACALLQCV
jgi:hypothetical protein